MAEKYKTKLKISNLDIYLEDLVLPYKGRVGFNFDALNWWKNNSCFSCFCTLYMMACDVLYIPLINASSGSAFGATCKIIDQCHGSFLTETLQLISIDLFSRLLAMS